MLADVFVAIKKNIQKNPRRWCSLSISRKRMNSRTENYLFRLSPFRSLRSFGLFFKRPLRSPHTCRTSRPRLEWTSSDVLPERQWHRGCPTRTWCEIRCERRPIAIRRFCNPLEQFPRSCERVANCWLACEPLRDATKRSIGRNRTPNSPMVKESLPWVRRVPQCL